MRVCVFMGVCVLTAAKSREEDVSAKYLGCGAIHVSKVVRLFFQVILKQKLINSTCGCGVDVRKKNKIVKAPSQKIYRHLADKN